MYVSLDRRIFCRQAERVPAHGVKDIVAKRAAMARNNIAHGVISDMPHVELARRIGKHLKDVGFFLSLGL